MLGAHLLKRRRRGNEDGSESNTEEQQLLPVSTAAKKEIEEPLLAKKDDDLKKVTTTVGDEAEAFEFYYHIWSLLYMIGFLVHCRKRFNKNVLICGLHILAYIVNTRSKYVDPIFLSFLMFSVYSTVETSPYNANHHNMVGFVSLLLLPQQIRRCYYTSQLHSNSNSNSNSNNSNHNTPSTAINVSQMAGTAETLNVVRWAVVLMYFMAGFHKLNWDFLNPAVSCAFNKVRKYFQLFGIKKFGYDLPWILLTLPYQVLLVEMATPVMLYYTKYRKYGLLILIGLHLILLPVGFADFGTIAQSFLWLFVSPSNIMDAGLPKQFFTDMACGFLVYEAITMFLWHAWDTDKVPLKSEECSLPFLAYMVIWRHVFRIFDRYQAPELVRPKSKWSMFALGFFLWFTLNPYLGLRNVGCLTMFSNLRTEGPTSNHILLGSNPLKIFGYQDDIVEAIAMDKRLDDNMEPGDILPRISFETDIVHEVMEDKLKDFAMTIKYKNTIMETTDLLNDPQFDDFKRPHPLWVRKWMDFRFIQQPGTPQKCTW